MFINTGFEFYTCEGIIRFPLFYGGKTGNKMKKTKVASSLRSWKMSNLSWGLHLPVFLRLPFVLEKLFLCLGVPYGCLGVLFLCLGVTDFLSC